MFKHMFVYVLLCVVGSTIYGFEVGIRLTKCSLDKENFSDPCQSLYKAICDGSNCKCPTGTKESKTLKICQKVSSSKLPKPGGDDLFDLPFDYTPNADKNKKLPEPSPSTTPSNFVTGIQRTKCSLSPGDFNDPCGSLYSAICDGSHCKCPTGTHESETLKSCQKGSAPKSSGSGDDDLFDLPFDYVPDKNKNKTISKPAAGDIAPGAISPTNTNTNNYPGQPQQPGGGHPQSGNPNQPAYPNQPYPNQPSYPVYPNQPYPNQPAYPNQPVYPNQPAYPNQPGYPPQPANSYGGGDPHIGEKAGGGIGGGLGLIIIIGLIYFCCKRGKGNNQIMDMLSKFKGGGGGGPMAGPFGGGGGGGYPMNQIRGQQIYASPTEQNSIPPVEGGKYDDAPPPYGFKS